MTKKLTIALGMILALGAASLVLAHYDFEGNGTGDPLGGGGPVPFSFWEGTLADVPNPYFTGFWGGDWFNGIATTLHTHYFVYHPNVDENNYWQLNGTKLGQWDGMFSPLTAPDTAYGTWWTAGYLEEGTWAGKLKD